jgi:hypothetical protein
MRRDIDEARRETMVLVDDPAGFRHGRLQPLKGWRDNAMCFRRQFLTRRHDGHL